LGLGLSNLGIPTYCDTSLPQSGGRTRERRPAEFSRGYVPEDFTAKPKTKRKKTKKVDPKAKKGGKAGAKNSKGGKNGKATAAAGKAAGKEVKVKAAKPEKRVGWDREPVEIDPLTKKMLELKPNTGEYTNPFRAAHSVMRA